MTFVDDKRLSLNEAKCKFMFVSRKKACSIPPPALTLRNCELKRVVDYKYLGVTLTSDLSWKTHNYYYTLNQKQSQEASWHPVPKVLTLHPTKHHAKLIQSPIVEYAAIA